MTGSPKEITQDRKLTLMTTFRLNDCHSLDDFFFFRNRSTINNSY